LNKIGCLIHFEVEGLCFFVWDIRGSTAKLAKISDVSSIRILKSPTIWIVLIVNNLLYAIVVPIFIIRAQGMLKYSS